MTISFKSCDMNLSNKNNFHTLGSKRKGASVTTSEDNNRATIVSKAIFTAMSEANPEVWLGTHLLYDDISNMVRF